MNTAAASYVTGYYNNNIEWASVLLGVKGSLAVFTMVQNEQDSVQGQCQLTMSLTENVACLKGMLQMKL